MIIKEMFEKDINRNIETVIKADDLDHISDEVAEYVITNEIATKISDLFQAYNDYAGANGVWISGFFGSGKSHLLKILSYVLEDKEFDGYKSGELFAEKIENDELLKGDILTASRRPSESILFNIDQQAQITSKSDENAILSVFYKVFYDHLGYYGYQPHVAEFEMWLDKQGQYDEFKTMFNERFGKSWEVARTDYFDPLVTDAIAEVLGKLNNTDASKYEDILDEIEDKQKQSIEDFADKVQEYIQTKPDGFRLNFFVDEVGQYISDNSKLMLNLQTIAETLATHTKGNSWVLVTSQEDMESIVGDMSKNQQNDFSRIQARFKIKIPLTSANVDEVIEKRLLKKKEDAQKLLLKVYDNENAHLDSLLSFSDAGVQFKGYQGDVDYANKYPFVSYQFDLFQQCRRALSTHNAFQGKHASIGERSMLGVFQQVVQSIEDRDEKALVRFDLMFEGLRNELKGEIQSSIILAEKNLDNPFAIAILKTLFMVKYYNNFKTTRKNISVMMIDDIDVDLRKHEKQVDEALNMLENQSYVQRNGDIYEYLTDAEKDVEEEIKSTDIDESATDQLLKEILFDEIIKDNKIKYLENNHYYDFSSKIDGSIFGREKELGIEIITENYSDYDNPEIIKVQTMGTTVMRMLLPSNAVFMRDLRMFLRTNKYIKQNQSTSNSSEVKRILHEKGTQNAERRRDLISIANKLLADSTVFINGGKHTLGSTTDGKTLVVNAFQDLVKTVYSNLRMLGDKQYSEETIKNVMRSVQDDLFASDDKTMSEAESEVLNYVNRRKTQSERTSLNDLKTHFTRKPYGWYPNAIWTIVAKLYKRGKLELKQDSNLLEDEDALNALLNSAYQGNTLLYPQADIDPKMVNNLRQLCSDAFDEQCTKREAKDVANAFKDKLKEMSIEVNQLLAQKHEYPFLKSLEGFADQLEKWTNKDYSYFINKQSEYEDELLDNKEDLLNPIKRFMNGNQLAIYDSIRKMLNSDTSNFNYVEGEELELMRALIKNDKPYSGKLIREAKIAKDSLSKKLLERIGEEKEKATEYITNAIANLKGREDFNSLADARQQLIINPLQLKLELVEKQNYIGVIRDAKAMVTNELLPQQLTRLLAFTKQENPTDDGVVEPKIHYINKSQIKADFPKSELKTEEDVDEYIAAYSKALKEQIKNNRRIAI